MKVRGSCSLGDFIWNIIFPSLQKAQPKVFRFILTNVSLFMLLIIYQGWGRSREGGGEVSDLCH